MATLDKQIELEYRMVQSGIHRYNKGMEELLGKGLGSKTKHGRTITVSYTHLTLPTKA